MGGSTEPEYQGDAAGWRIVDDAWTELRRSPFVRAQRGEPLHDLPEISIGEVSRRADIGRDLLRRVDKIDLGRVSHRLALALKLVAFRADSWGKAQRWYWLAADPFGKGVYGLFAPSAYCGAALIEAVQQRLASFTFAGSEDCDRYLELMSAYGGLIHQFETRALEQARRGILLPRPQIARVRGLLIALRRALRGKLMVDPARVPATLSASFRDRCEAQISNLIEPAYGKMIDLLSDDYARRAPERVGLSQYQDGDEIYRELATYYTTLDLSVEEIHERGLDRMGRIVEEMRVIRDQVEYSGTSADYIREKGADPRWRASTEAEIAAVFERYIERIKPHLGRCFTSLPRAPYGVAPLPEALRESMTFGYYDRPRPGDDYGRYIFNPKHLGQQPLLTVAALTYHELMPGHHLQLAGQQEDEGLHPFCVYTAVTAFIEGWAEYAATLAGELGLYEEPEERYGRLIMDAFLTSRLVVDTGMNALGWSLERARAYMLDHSGLDLSVIQSETLRYSCDIPGHALAYKLGDTHIINVREDAKHRAGSSFDLSKFHEATLAAGSLQLRDLEWHVRRAMA